MQGTDGAPPKDLEPSKAPTSQITIHLSSTTTALLQPKESGSMVGKKSGKALREEGVFVRLYTPKLLRSQSS